MAAVGIIQRLDETVVNKIAAGEVVQRPANALKEMLENCLDANSSQISVTVKQGGLRLLQIQDNGTGIRKSDMGIVCERFTTSKLREYGDLQQISTFGFRGEALASISHVAHLTIITKTKDDQCAWKCSYIDGKPKDNPRPCAGNQGTQITVEDLFYNVPTRKKALHSAAEEHARIAEVMSSYAIHNSSVGFSLKKQGESSADLRTSPRSTPETNIRTVFGGAVAKELLQVSCSDDGLQFSCSGLITNANYCAKRCVMLLFINDRLVESRALRKVLETVYSTYLPKQSHPFIYLSLKISPRNVDVNVHPTKHEVSFLHEDAIIAAIQKAVEDKLLGSNASRTFYTQSLLPGASSSQPPSDGAASGRVYDHSLVRTSAKEQKITKYWSSERANNQHSVQPDLQQTPPSRRELRLTSVQSLLESVRTDCHSGLQDILRNHSFVGCVDHSSVLIQHSTHLYLARTKPLCEQMFYQILLNDFGNFGVIKLTPPASVRELALLALDQPESGWTEADGSKEHLADYILTFLRSKAAMLLDYFSITIDDDGCLTTLPYLLDDFLPCLTGLPLFVLRLTTEVAWDSELDCFRSLCLETAQFYASPPLPGEDEMNPTAEEGSKEKPESSKWCWQVEQLVFPALRSRLLPPKHLAHDTSLLQLVDLHHLYKVFERC